MRPCSTTPDLNEWPIIKSGKGLSVWIKCVGKKVCREKSPAADILSWSQWATCLKWENMTSHCNFIRVVCNSRWVCTCLIQKMYRCLWRLMLHVRGIKVESLMSLGYFFFFSNLSWHEHFTYEWDQSLHPRLNGGLITNDGHQKTSCGSGTVLYVSRRHQTVKCGPG